MSSYSFFFWNKITRSEIALKKRIKKIDSLVDIKTLAISYDSLLGSSNKETSFLSLILILFKSFIGSPSFSKRGFSIKVFQLFKTKQSIFTILDLFLFLFLTKRLNPYEFNRFFSKALMFNVKASEFFLLSTNQSLLKNVNFNIAFDIKNLSLVDSVLLFNVLRFPIKLL